MSNKPQGPGTVAGAASRETYAIPPSWPVYSVTYVTQSTHADGTVQSSYSAGYLGGFVYAIPAGVVVVSGSGYYYPPYIYHPRYGYPVYYPYAPTYGAYGTTLRYNSATGAYGVSQTAFSPYGSATRRAAYSPYTGTFARSASASTPYGSRSVGQAYNPYTGTYAATRQGSSPTAQWGSSVVTKGNQSAYAQHYATAQRSAASVQTSSGAKAARTRTAYGDTIAGKTASGDMYAGHDGNIYKNTGSGWKSYSDGKWNSVQSPTAASTQSEAERAQQQSESQGDRERTREASSSQVQDLQQEAQNRQRGAQASQRFQSAGNYAGGARRRR